MIPGNLAVVAQILGLIGMAMLALMSSESCPRFGPVRVALPRVGTDAVMCKFEYLNSCSQASLSPGTTEMFSTCHV